MANTLITPTIVAKEAAVILKDNMVLGNKVYNAFSKEFVSGVGVSIKVRVPMTPNVRDFSGTATPTTVTESFKTITLTKHKYDQFSLTSLDMTLNITDFSKQIIEPTMIAFAEQIESDIADLYKKTPYYSGTPGTTPSALSDISALKKVMTDLKIPGNKSLVMDSSAEDKMLQLASFANVNQSGTDSVMKEGDLGRRYGMDLSVSQSIKDHTKGTLTAQTAIAAKGINAIGATSIVLDDSADGTLVGTLVVGDIITFAGDTTKYLVTTLATSSAGEVTMVIDSGLIGE